MSWIALRVTPDSNRDGVIAALFASGSQGVQEDGPAVVTHFPADAPIADIRSMVMRADPSATIAISESPDADYSEWRASVSAHEIGELVIAPPWLASQYEPGKVIVVDPVMAFGTGEHPTTRGVMRLMQGVVRDGDVVADLGAGSAVLSIAAARLGAARVAAVEIDHDSIGNAEENVRTNGESGKVEVIEGDAMVILPLLAPVRVVLANIISSVLIAMLPIIRDALAVDGQAILSGILVEERDAMIMALEANGWTIQREDTEDVWWSVQIAPR
ncbi:MAG TPA: 50S ribosomal protein L11 methyltransferase [Gemmatimonadaceae bacterium]|nr:50S ribosomal protein L11 methyltransferase [Gemmatimonadaceae bacterium]